MTNILGIGNVLMGDDGFGPAVVRAFQAEHPVGPDVNVFDLGTPGLDLTPWLADVDRVIVVDTVRSDAAPGTLRVYDRADILRHAPTLRVAPHDPGLKEALLTLEFAGRAPRQVLLIGVVPKSIAVSMDLSQPLRDAIPDAVAAIAAAVGPR